MKLNAALLALVLIVSAAGPLWACPEPSTEEQILQAFGEEEYEMARCVAWHESRLVSTAVNPETGTSGSFQIHPGWKGVMAREGLDYEVDFDRIMFARQLQRRDGWGQHWVRAAQMCGG